jgi:long-chain acyl-CoA synthetase
MKKVISETGHDESVISWNQILHNKLKQDQDRLFCIDHMIGKSRTKADIYQHSVNIANKLHRLGVKKGDRIGIILGQEFGSNILCVYYACIWLGAVSMPIGLHYKAKERKELLKKCDPMMIITSKTTQGELSDGRWNTCPVTLLEDILVESKKHSTEELAFLMPTLHYEDIIFVLFTSGTTGQAKGACLTVQALILNCQAAGERFAYLPSDRLMIMSPLVHSYGIAHAGIMPLLFGFSVALNPPFDMKLCTVFWERVQQDEITIASAVPSILSSLLLFKDNFSGQAGRIKYFLCASAVLLPSIRKEFKESFGIKICEIYGSTEGSIMATQLPEKTEMGWIPLANTMVKIAEDGEILIHSAYLFQGYINDEKENQACFSYDSDNRLWFRTGDVGQLGAEGTFELTDRKKDLIIKGGYNISPSQIDQVLIRHESVIDVITVGIPDEIYGEEVVAAVKVKEPYNGLEAVLFEHCQDYFIDRFCPKEFIFFEELPKTGMGKPDRKRVKQLILEQIT